MSSDRHYSRRDGNRDRDRSRHRHGHRHRDRDRDRDRDSDTDRNRNYRDRDRRNRSLYRHPTQSDTYNGDINVNGAYQGDINGGYDNSQNNSRNHYYRSSKKPTSLQMQLPSLISSDDSIRKSNGIMLSVVETILQMISSKQNKQLFVNSVYNIRSNTNNPKRFMNCIVDCALGGDFITGSDGWWIYNKIKTKKSQIQPVSDFHKSLKSIKISKPKEPNKLWLFLHSIGLSRFYKTFAVNGFADEFGLIKHLNEKHLDIMKINKITDRIKLTNAIKALKEKQKAQKPKAQEASISPKFPKNYTYSRGDQPWAPGPSPDDGPAIDPNVLK